MYCANITKQTHNPFMQEILILHLNPLKLHRQLRQGILHQLIKKTHPPIDLTLIILHEIFQKHFAEYQIHQQAKHLRAHLIKVGFSEADHHTQMDQNQHG